MEEFQIFKRTTNNKILKPETIRSLFQQEEITCIEQKYQNNIKTILYYIRQKYSGNSKIRLNCCCGKQLNYSQLKRAVIRDSKPHCCISCGNKDPDVLEKIKNTSLEIYGTSNLSQQEIVKNKVKTTNLAKRGVRCSFQDPVVKEKIKATNLKTRGVPYSAMDPEVKKKIIQTNLNRYGTKYPMQNKEIQERSVRNKLENYPNRHILYNILEYYKEPLNYKDIKEISNLCEVTTTHVKNVITDLDIKFIPYRDDEELSSEVYKRVSLSNRQDYVNWDFLDSIQETFLDRKTYEEYFQKSGYKHIQQWNNFLRFRNIKFEKINAIKQREILEFVEQFGFDCLEDDNQQLDGLQIDIYIPELKLGIEFNGDYWHQQESRNPKPADYHLNKTELAESKGIRLIHIWEHEWNSDKDFCKKVIQMYLNGKIPLELFSDKSRLSRDYFQRLDFPNYTVEEPILEKFNNFNIYKTGYLIEN